MKRATQDEISARIERLLTAQPTAPPEARRVRRQFAIEKRWEVSQRHLGLQLRVDKEFAAAYRRPGQYVTLKVEGWPARFFVIASRPEDDLWEFLIDRKGELGPVLEKIEVGETLQVSLPEGAGFDAREAGGAVAMMFCTGSGVATMRPLIRCWLNAGEAAPSEMVLYYGEREGGDFAWTDLLAQWRDRGIKVYRAVEDVNAQVAGSEIPYRYVQHAFEAEHPPVQDAFAYLSGAPVMIQMVAGKLLRLGLAPSRVKINI